MWCANHDDKNLTNKTIWRIARTFISLSMFMCFFVEGSLSLGGHVVIGVASFHHAYAIPSVDEC